MCDDWLDGFFYTIYLAPKDYHRVHMPIDGKLLRMRYIPGRLFSVAPYTVRQVPRLFARNERLVNIFQTTAGPVAQVLVGAMLVASMETVWAGEVTPNRFNTTQTWDYDDEPLLLARGADHARSISEPKLTEMKRRVGFVVPGY